MLVLLQIRNNIYFLYSREYICGQSSAALNVSVWAELKVYPVT